MSGPVNNPLTVAQQIQSTCAVQAAAARAEIRGLAKQYENKCNKEKKELETKLTKEKEALRTEFNNEKEELRKRIEDLKNLKSASAAKTSPASGPASGASAPIAPSLDMLVGGRRSRKMRRRKTVRKGGGCSFFGCGRPKKEGRAPPSHGNGLTRNAYNKTQASRVLKNVTPSEFRSALEWVRRNKGDVAGRTRSKHEVDE